MPVFDLTTVQEQHVLTLTSALMTRDECYQEAFRLNEAAGRMILTGRYPLASLLLHQAAIWSPTLAGRQALEARAVEVAAMEPRRVD